MSIRRKNTKLKENQIELSSGENLSEVINATKNFVELIEDEINDDLIEDNQIISGLNSQNLALSNGINPLNQVVLYEPFTIGENTNVNIKPFNKESSAFFGQGNNLIENEIIKAYSFLDRGDCEGDHVDNLHPIVLGQLGPPVITDAAFVRSSEQVYQKSFSYKFTRGTTGTLTTPNFVDLQKTADISKTHGLNVGSTYKYSAWIYIPSTNTTMVGTDVNLSFYDYDPGTTSWIEHSVPCSNTYDQWQYVENTFTILPDASGTITRLASFAGTVGDIFYVDNIKLEEIKKQNGDNYYSENKVSIKTVDESFIGNNINNGNCEGDDTSALHPMIVGETTWNSALNTSFVRSAAQSYAGNYSYLITKTIASGTEGICSFTDSQALTDLHGIIPGKTYKLSAWVYIPSVGGPDLSEVNLKIGDYDSDASSWSYSSSLAPTSSDAWEYIEVIRRVADDADAATIMLEINSAADNNEYIYIDEIKLEELQEVLITPVNGNQLYKIINEDTSSCYVDKDILFNSNENKSFQLIAKKGNTATSSFKIIEDKSGTPVDILDITITWTTKAFTETAGSVHSYEWIDDETVWIGCITSIVDMTKTHTIRLLTDGTAVGDYTYYGALMAEDNVYPTPYVYPNKVRKIKNNSYDFSLPETFTIDTIINPWFIYNTPDIKTIAKFPLSASSYFSIEYNPTTDMFEVKWRDGGTERVLQSQQFDDGTTYDDINQEIRITASIDLTTGDTSGSELWIDNVSTDTTWSGNIDLKTSSFNTFNIGNDEGATIFDGLIKYVNVWNGTSIQAEINSSFEGKTLLLEKTFDDYIIAREDDVLDLTDVKNYMSRGNCEWDNTDNYPPMVQGEIGPNLFAHDGSGSDPTFERSSDFAYRGDYSYKYTKLNPNLGGGGGNCFVYFQNTIDTADFHDLSSGVEYTFSAWIYIPTASGVLGSEVQLNIGDYSGSWDGSASFAQNIYDQWQYVEVKKDIRNDATGIVIQSIITNTADSGEYFYIDDIKLTTSFTNTKTNLDPIGTKRGIVGIFNETVNYLRNPENLTSDWNYFNISTELVNDYFNGSRFTKITGTGAQVDPSVYQDQESIPTDRNIFLSCVLRKGNVNKSGVNYYQLTPGRILFSAGVIWDKKEVYFIVGHSLNYKWLDDETVYIEGLTRFSTAASNGRFQIWMTDNAEQNTSSHFYVTRCFTNLYHVKKTLSPYNPTGNTSNKFIYPFEYNNKGTMEIWVKPKFLKDLDTVFPVIFDMRDSGDNDNRFVLGFNPAVKKYEFGLVKTSATDLILITQDVEPSNDDLQKWTHFKITWDNTNNDNCQLFINGVKQTDIAITGNGFISSKIPERKRLVVGNDYLLGNSSCFNGYLSDFSYKPYVDFSNEHYNKNTPYYDNNKIKGVNDNFNIDKYGNAFFKEVFNGFGKTVAVESGSNANGTYIKYSDGTMVCYGSTASVPINLPYNTHFYRNLDHYYPVVFISRPIVSLRPVRTAGTDLVMIASSLEETTYTRKGVERFNTYFLCSNDAGSSCRADFIAIGRWK